MAPHGLLVVAFVLPHAGCTTDEHGVHLEWTEHPDLRAILTDGDGRTLYVFANDEDGQSNCHDQCAANLPPCSPKVDPRRPTT